MRERSETLTPAIIQFKYFVVILTLFSSMWLIANIAAIKLVLVFNMTFTGAFFIFPFTTMLNTIIVEVYGYKNSRQAIWAGFVLNLSFILLMNLVNIIPASPYWHDQTAFNTILIPDTRIIIASLISFFLSDFSNSYLMAKMKIKSHGNSILRRILLAYSLSISIDLICFICLAYAGTMPIYLLLQLIVAAYIKRILCQVSLLPFMCYLIDFLKRKENIEIYDYDTKFNPFSLDNCYELRLFKKVETFNS